MRAEYAHLMSRRYAMVASYDADHPIRILHTEVYPFIYGAIRKGLNTAIIAKAPSEAVMDLLMKDGFRVFYRGTSGAVVNWTSPVIFSSKGQPAL